MVRMCAAGAHKRTVRACARSRVSAASGRSRSPRSPPAIAAGALAHLLGAPRAARPHLGRADRGSARAADRLVRAHARARGRRRRRDRASSRWPARHALGEELAGAVIALMLSGGNALETAAGRRARRELTALLERAPKVAHRTSGGGARGCARRGARPRRRGARARGRGGAGRRLVVADGEARARRVDADGRAAARLPGDREPCFSGAANAGAAFDMRATRPPPRARTPASCASLREAGPAARALRAHGRPLRRVPSFPSPP